MKKIFVLICAILIIACQKEKNDSAMNNIYIFKLSFNSYNVNFRSDSIREIYMIGEPNYYYENKRYYFVKTSNDTFKIIIPIGVNTDTFYNCTYHGINIIGYINYGILKQRILFIRQR
jgi:hypothetical protein